MIANTMNEYSPQEEALFDAFGILKAIRDSVGPSQAYHIAVETAFMFPEKMEPIWIERLRNGYRHFIRRPCSDELQNLMH